SDESPFNFRMTGGIFFQRIKLAGSIFINVVGTAVSGHAAFRFNNPHVTILQLNDIIRIEIAAPERHTVNNAEILIALITVLIAPLNRIVMLAPVLKGNLCKSAIRLNKDIIAVIDKWILVHDFCACDTFVLLIVLLSRDCPVCCKDICLFYLSNAVCTETVEHLYETLSV